MQDARRAAGIDIRGTDRSPTSFQNVVSAA
jgi:hypothetical protein